MAKRNQAVMLLHGIRTHAKWQKEFADALSERSFVHHTYDYGRFGIGRFVSPKARLKQIDDFYTWYCDTRDKSALSPAKRADFRPNIIAHSFGTYIVGYALRKFSDLKVNKIVFCGSILPRDFDWITLFGRNQVSEVRNDYGVEDFWSRVARHLVRDAGSSGADGFDTQSPLVCNTRYDHFGHSDYFRRGHYDQWIKFLEEPTVRFKIVRSSELPKGMTWPEAAIGTRTIDALVYGGLDSYSDVAIPQGLSSKWMEVNPDLYTILMDQSDRIHGYINAMPLKKSSFDAILTGGMNDDDVKPVDIVSFVDGTEINLYLMSIAIHPEARKMHQGVDQSAFHRLLYGLTHRLEQLAAERSIYVRRMGAVGWTDEGRRLCEILGMRELGTDEFKHPSYLLDLAEPIEGPVHPLIRGLKEAYRQLKGRKKGS